MPDPPPGTARGRPVRGLLEKIGSMSGIDRAVGFTLLGKVWALLSFPVTLYLVTTVFSKETQGLFYTFSSILLLQVFLELGFDTVMVQFVSHEWAHLALDARSEIAGDPAAASRLASLVRLSARWYSAVAVLFFAAVGTAGYLFLGLRAAAADFARPWLLLAATGALSLLLIPLKALIEGTNQVDRSQKIALVSAIVGSVAGWVAIRSGAGLYALAVINGLTAATSCVLLIPACAPFFRLLRRCPGGSGAVSWRAEFWPQQWRIAVSWLSGFFMFQSFVPFLYYFDGPVAAGRMGATLSVYNAVNAFSMAWVFAAGPRMGALSARRDFPALRSLARGVYIRSAAASVVFSAGALSVLWAMRFYRVPQSERFADLASVALFLVTLIGMQLSNVETQAVRFQKKEPFYKVSVAGALLCLASNAVLGKYFGIPGVVAGFGAIMFFFLIPSNHKIYSREMGKVGA
jgi:hypothetical protein